MSRAPYLRLRRYTRNGLLGAIKSIHLEEEGEKTSALHSHDFYELVAVVQGEGYHVINGHEVPLKRGQVFLIPPRVRHNFRNFHQVILQNFMFSRRALRLSSGMLRTLPEAVQRLFKAPPAEPVAYLDGEALTELELLHNTLELENRQFTKGRELAALACFVQLMSRVFLHAESDDTVGVLRDNKIDNAINYMQRNYKKQITLAELAKQSFMAPVTLIQHFRKEFNTTPMQWLLKLRLHHACRLLMRSELSMTDVAQSCGFNDPLYFTRQFHRLLGCTPREFRHHGLGHIQVFSENEFLREDWFLEM